MTIPSAASTFSRNSSAKYHKLHISNHSGGIFKVASVTTTTVVLSDGSEITGKALYTATEPGMLVIVEGVNSSDVGKTSNITGISSNTLTIDDDFSTTPALAAGDLVAVIPPMASELTTNGGHTIQVNRTKEESIGLGESLLTHNTAMQVDPSGSIPFYLCRDSQAVARLLAMGTGAYKKSTTGTHKYRPYATDDGTFDEVKDGAIFSRDGNSILQQVYLGIQGTQLDLNFPNVGVATGSLTVMGTHAVREVGGTGKTFLSGASNWNRGSDIERDGGNRHTYNGVFVEFGGSFGSALSTADRYVLEANAQIVRTMSDHFPLGSQERVVPVEDTVTVQVTGRRILENDTIYQDFFGTSADATPGAQTETRLLLKAVHPGDTSKTLSLDIPRGVWKVDDVQRERGRFIESFTYQGIQTVSSGAVSTSTPLFEITFENGDDVDLIDAL